MFALVVSLIQAGYYTPGRNAFGNVNRRLGEGGEEGRGEGVQRKLYVRWESAKTWSASVCGPGKLMPDRSRSLDPDAGKLR